MKIEFAPVTSFKQINEASLILEISAVINGLGVLDDIQPDLPLLLSEIKSAPGAFDLEGELDFLEAEDFAAENLTREKFGRSVASVLDRRAEILGVAYPFELNYADGPMVTLKPAAQINTAGLAVIALSIFLVLQDANLAQISKEDRAKFSRVFEPIFELICCLALAADNEGVVWWNGRSRSKKTFLFQLNRIRNFAGSGLVRQIEQLQANQVGVNDGGVDGFGISTFNGAVGPDAVCAMLGATLQRSARRNKIVGPAELIRLGNFFVNSPTLVFQGILAVPFPRHEAEALDCREQNCRYFPIEVINRNLQTFAARGNLAHTLSFTRRLNFLFLSSARKLTADLRLTLNAGEQKIPWP